MILASDLIVNWISKESIDGILVGLKLSDDLSLHSVDENKLAAD